MSLEKTDIVITNGIKTWWTYPVMMRWKKIQRDKLSTKNNENIISGINSSLIVDCTCFLEGIFDLAIREKINYRQDGNYELRINNHLLERLENAQFNEYQKLYYLVFGNELKDVADNETWKAIKSLFSLRNLIVHGTGVSIDFCRINGKYKIVGIGKYKSILNYLIEIKLDPRNKFNPKSGIAYYHIWEDFVDLDGYPGIKPPWGTLTSMNLNTGKIVWQVPLGEYESLTKRNISITGTQNRSGATATAGGLVFVSGTHDRKIRAFDALNGKELWSYKMSFIGSAPPTSYMIDEKQYIIIPTFEKDGDELIAFSIKLDSI